MGQKRRRLHVEHRKRTQTRIDHVVNLVVALAMIRQLFQPSDEHRPETLE